MNLTSFQIECTLVCHLWSFSVFYSYNCLQTESMFWRHQACTDLLDCRSCRYLICWISPNPQYCKKQRIISLKMHRIKYDHNWQPTETMNATSDFANLFELLQWLCTGCAKCWTFLNFATLMCIQMQSLAKSMSSNNNVWSTSGYERLNPTFVVIVYQFSSRPSLNT